MINSPSLQTNVAAAGGGTGGTIELPDANVAYVRTGATGGTVGDAADPFPDIDTAKAAMTNPFLFDLDNGTHILNLTAANLATTNLYYFRGSGPGTVVNITCTVGASPPGNPPAGGEAVTFGSGGSPFIVQSDHSCTINFPCTGGVGGDDDSGGDADGGLGGAVNGRLHIKNAITNTAGFTGGLGGAGSGTGGQGATGTVAFTDLSTFNCQVTDANNRVTSALDSVVNGAFTVGANPAGSGSELQFRSSGSAFGAVTRSSVSGGAVTLGGTEALGTTPTAYLTLQNTTAAAAGAQQVSPSLRWLGNGWKTTATAASQACEFATFVSPVQGTTNPTNQLVFAAGTNGAALANVFVIQSDAVSVPTQVIGIYASSGGNRGIFAVGSNAIFAGSSSVGNPDGGSAMTGSGIFTRGDTGQIGFSSGTSPTGTIDVFFMRGGAAATMQMGINTAVNSATATAQTFKAPNATGTTSTGGSLTIAGGTGTSAGGAVILATSATTGAATAAVTCGADGSVIFGKLPASAVTLGTNGQVTMEFTGDTTLTFRARGSDGVSRTATLTLA